MSNSASGGSRLHPALSDQQVLALINEVQSAQNLLRDSISAIADLREPMIHGDAVFTLGSIGVEKAMKILLGCDEVEQEGRWPTLPTLKGWGHDIEALNSRLATIVRDAPSTATASGYATTLMTFIEQSTILPLLFGTLSQYGRSGRFHYLNILATNERNKFDPPQEFWTQLENHVTNTELGFAPVPYGDPAEFEDHLGRLSRRIADELNDWWFCVHRLGVQGCFGTLGKDMGWAIWPSRRPAPSRFK
jgi:hypothetical protein